MLHLQFKIIDIRLYLFSSHLTFMSETYFNIINNSEHVAWINLNRIFSIIEREREREREKIGNF